MLASLDSGKRIRAMVNAHRAGLSGDGDAKPKPAKVVIKRDEDGNISEIIEELPDNKNDISTLYTSLLENRTTFEIKNGQCVPIRLSMVVRSTTGYTAESVTHFTPLCRDFIELFEENPQLTHAISKQINDEVVEAIRLQRLQIGNLMSSYRFEQFPPKKVIEKFISDAVASQITDNVTTSSNVIGLSRWHKIAPVRTNQARDIPGCSCIRDRCRL